MKKGYWIKNKVEIPIKEMSTEHITNVIAYLGRKAREIDSLRKQEEFSDLQDQIREDVEESYRKRDEFQAELNSRMDNRELIYNVRIEMSCKF